MKRANGFLLVVPDAAESWSNRKLRYRELCYVCGKPCNGQGKSVPLLGRVCADDFDRVVMEGSRALLKNRPEFTIKEVEDIYSVAD